MTRKVYSRQFVFTCTVCGEDARCWSDGDTKEVMYKLKYTIRDKLQFPSVTNYFVELDSDEFTEEEEEG